MNFCKIPLKYERFLFLPVRLLVRHFIETLVLQPPREERKPEKLERYPINPTSKWGAWVEWQIFNFLYLPLTQVPLFR